MVKVSVIIPVLNDCKRLGHFENTIHSLEKQSFTDYEIIVVLNGKRDSNNKLLNFAKKYADKVLVLNHNGASNARNQGVKCAEGEFIVIADDHVLFEENVLQEIVETLERGNYTGTCSMKPDRNGFLFWFVSASKNALHEVGNVSYKFYRFGVAGANGLVYCRKDLFDKIGGFNKYMNTFELYDFFDRAVVDGGAKYKNIGCAYVTFNMDKYKENGLLGIWGYWVKEALIHTNKYRL